MRCDDRVIYTSGMKGIWARISEVGPGVEMNGTEWCINRNKRYRNKDEWSTIVCPRRSDPFYTVAYYTTWVTTSCLYFINLDEWY